MIVPLDGITMVDALKDSSRDHLFKPVGYFRRCPPLFQCVIPPENFPGTVEEYKAACQEFEVEYGKYQQDYSCGKAIRLSVPFGSRLEALDALQRVYDAWVVPKLTSMGLDPLDPYQ